MRMPQFVPGPQLESARTEALVGCRARKVSGSYEATGAIKAAFEADDGSIRVVFRFDNPAGLLHIFSLEPLEIEV